MARGENELIKGFEKAPLHCYLPTKQHEEYSMPKAAAKSHRSNLFHSHLCRNLLLSHLIELPIQRAFRS